MQWFIFSPYLDIGLPVLFRGDGVHAFTKEFVISSSTRDTIQVLKSRETIVKKLLQFRVKKSIFLKRNTLYRCKLSLISNDGISN